SFVPGDLTVLVAYHAVIPFHHARRPYGFYCRDPNDAASARPRNIQKQNKGSSCVPESRSLRPSPRPLRLLSSDRERDRDAEIDRSLHPLTSNPWVTWISARFLSSLSP
ncbi:hypothetical protein B296_00040361, partial [Ensete ventricosum]